jgi:hypothetical protein
MATQPRNRGPALWLGNTVRVPLGPGAYATVDAEDWPKVAPYTWGLDTNGYAFALVDGRRTLLHRFLTDPAPTALVDHWDLDRLNCRRGNLRVATHAQNSGNVALSSRNRSGYKGVSWDRANHAWKATIRIDGRNQHLGQFGDVVLAARAYDTAAREQFGEFARLNFPEAGERGCRDEPD